MTAQIETGSGLRDRARQFIERRSVSNAILGVIIFNAVTLGLSTSDTVMAEVGPAIRAVDDVALTIFVLEIAIKLYAHGLRFFTNAWNIFDFLVVGFGLLPDQGGLSALRGLRVIRSLRLLSVIPQMRAVVQALLDALPGMGAVIVMISIVFYVFGVMATLMYGDTFDTWFGTLGRSLYSLFQIMTLESWSMGIVRPVMDVHPFAWAFFVPFIILTAFSVLNLFIGLLVNTMQSAVEAEEQQEFETLRELVRSETDQVDAHVLELKEEILALRREIAALNGRGNG
ncbi:ion transporter [Albidovulum sp.]|uniref:ion transporter n=1 Tax=Albidovulum sp. TaxID=1872424 RepID=UPI001DE14BE9|nr:ion transporter [Paracoccaceae bacterium]HPE26189.1 ion transporter [Albidovulum sp.]MCB2119480.1 ion transporter [Paracoccaceae bacterium]MCB2122009.1 ion transporter [Paracoccaceae bacterium]MCB2138597.1 ion transporter [Paracoccaceae bacterium]